MGLSGSSVAFAIRGAHQNGFVRLFPRGEIDIATAPVLEEALAFVEQLQPVAIILDFHDITFVDSSGLHVLLRAHERAGLKQRILAVVNGSEPVRKLFEVTGTHHLFEPAILPEAAGAQDEWSPIPLPGPSL